MPKKQQKQSRYKNIKMSWVDSWVDSWMDKTAKITAV